MIQKIMTIDPGAGGGLAAELGSGEFYARKMPETIHDIVQVLRVWRAESNADVFVWMEKVGTYFPGNSGPSAAKFAEHVGTLKGILAGLRIPFDLVRPAQWEHYFIGKPNWPKMPPDLTKAQQKKIRSDRKRERKNLIKAKAQRLYPDSKVTLATSDAIGMFVWAKDFMKGAPA